METAFCQICITIQNTAERKEGRDRSMFLRNCRYFAGRRRGEQCLQTEKYYEDVRTMYLEMRAWRHDYKNHLQVMKAHLDMGEYQELADYMLRLDEELTRIDKVIKTGSLRLDAILNSKIALAKAKQIQVNVKVILPPHISVSDYDLCVLLGNLLDNAIEGCESQKEGELRFLRIYIGAFREQLYLCVSNSHATEMNREGKRYRSTKASHRGLGTYSIDSIAARYQGCVNRQNDESVFVTEVMLPL